MTQRTATALRYDDGQLSILDQRALPAERLWVAVESTEHLVQLIQSLAIRGAPLIGIAAVLYLAVLARKGEPAPALKIASQALRESRPTAVNLMNLLDRINPVLDQGAAEVEAMALALFDEDVQLCDKIAEAGLPLVKNGARILTHCNTGGLPTAGRGTALGIITRAQEAGLTPFVWVDETRPLWQGARLTAYELQQAGVAHRLQVDSAAASLFASGQVDLVLVGADRIAANGDTANKVGTLMLAVLARHYGVPFYVAAPWTTVDPACPGGHAIPIEERSAEEICQLGDRQLAPQGTTTYNPGFDVTPATLISGWVTDRGLITEAAAFHHS
ncbi:S-methyl-5-thioribose-1-phosphate isomerase [Gallaecimonas kandeliae]|uniref:S-methyl-5-thioribose-1-phosphate isomerase n=1 Tax=Gallaecimonas kandeliae TaxID=3029055 RepID=UPI0026496ACF|nr:S-methyl-5-thioribose-1-phosphate isomerase [Gallaecimonas kandeliae]WKE64134.1 S-methyl-5-thioribose-1-phosphate isomerase [Gallaecimonas kandeliae]